MQNFSNSPAPPPIPPGFSGRSVGGPPCPPQIAETQISPRMTDDYIGMQQQSLHRGLHHPSQASHMLAYGSRSRGALEPPAQGSIHSGNTNNPYRKDAMEYYFSMGGKDRHRRGGMSFGGGFGYPNIDGHIPHQYRHPGSSSAPSSGLMSPYPVDYGSSAGSGGGAGAFSPSHQYGINQNAAMQSVPASQMQQRQHGQTFPAVHPAQQHRSYSHSGHRMTPQYPHYSPPGGASTGSSGMYSPPLQRYLDGAANAGFDPKVNSSPSVGAGSNSASTSAAANNAGLVESVQQSYHASNYPGYPPQSHLLHKQATLQHRNAQQSLVVGYDGSLKMPHQGPSPGSVYAKHHSAPNASIAQAAAQEIAKSPMHPNAQQMNQNFSPISNPSPAASAVHSPTCSSSPSPLMGVSEAHGNPSGHGPSHPPSSNARSSHARLLQTAPQLSPTPNSNSSISSCGSSGSHKAHSLSAVGGSGLPPMGRSKMGQGAGVKSREEGPSVYSASTFDKMQDAGLNSLNALSSQVANLPNTVQHMLLTDTVFSHRKKDGGQQAAHGAPQSQPRSRNASTASSAKDGGVARTGDGASSDGGPDEDSSVTPVEGSLGTKEEREEQFSEAECVRVRQMSGASSGSEATGYNQTQTGHASKTVASDSQSVEAVVTETKTKEAHIPSSSSSPSTPPVSSSPSSTSSSIPPATTHNCVPESGLTHSDHRGGEIKTEGEAAAEKTQKLSRQMQQDGEMRAKNGQDKENMLHSEYKSHNNNKKEEKDASEEQQNAGSVGVIVSARSEESHTERSRHSQDNCVEEKQLNFYLKESSSHNGEEGVDLSLNSSHHQKSNCGRLQNPPLSGSHKYNFPESTYGSDLSMKNRMRAGSGGVMETNPRYLSYQHSQAGYGPPHPKDAGSGAEALAKRGQQGAGAKAQEENSQMQQFPSLLQEVLQGYNLDRRYVRPEQAFSAHHQVQQQFSARHAFDMADSTRMHGESSAYSGQMSGSGKPLNQKNRNEPYFSTDAQSLVKSEVSSAKILQNADKTDVGVSQSHLLQAAESQQPPTKHINLSDYSLPQRKTSNVTASSSAVQELLLQEPEPLTGAAGQSKPQKSGSALAPSERRSVICDVSPNRSGTPERDREGVRETEREKSQSGASVIQQSFSSLAAPSDLSKRDAGEKHVVKMEMTSKEAGPGPVNLQTERDHGVGGVNEADIEFLSKASHSSSGMSADPYRRGSVDILPMPSHPLSTNTLSSPPRHHSYLHGVDLSAGSGSSFPGYRYGETREGSMMSRSFPSHHPYHHLPPQAQSTTKLQMYARGPPHPPHDMSDWVKAMTRPSKDMMMPHGSSHGRHKGSQSEQKQRGIPQTDLPSEQQMSKAPSLHHQSAYYDMKLWDSTHQGREGARMIEGDSYYRTQPPPPSPLPSPAPVVSHAPPRAAHGQNEPEVSRGATEEAKHPCPPPASSSAKPPADINATQPQRPAAKSGASADTNPLMLRRRVRSFISPIPAKRLHQDPSQQRAATNSHHSPGAQSESSHHHNEDDSSSSDMPCPRLSSPLPGENTFLQPLSPPSGNAKVLSARKGRGLKLEAIVQKITPNIKKPTGYTDDESNHFSAFSHSEIHRFGDSQDQDLPHFPRVTAGEDSYMDDSHSLNDMIPFRGVDDTGPLPPPVYPCDSNQTSQIIKQQDFDFGLGAGVSSASGDKEDFALLGPLPPPPPLPRPVQASPPPSSSALSDIQHFTNTYQQLETRKGEQSAANLLRQKLQETGMGFDDYPGSDYYGSTPPHQGHMLNRQHQMSSGMSSLSPQDSKPLENVVPKGYFPSGKKKGRPVGSVNKQKRAQNQVQPQAQAQAQAQVQTPSTPLSAPPAPPTPTPAAASTPPIAETNSSTLAPTEPTPPENASTPPLAPPILTQVVKADVESEDTQLEIEVKPVRRRRRGAKDEDEPLGTRGRQRRRRRGAVPAAPPMAKGEPDAPLEAGGALAANRVFLDPNRKGLFIPHIHVEKKIPEIGAVCTIVNAEEDKTKGERGAVGGKAGGTDSLLSSALASQLSKKDKEAEKREVEEVETTLQSGKALPSSGYVVSGPVITETNHSGRLLCCLCQKWANYKHLGDLYGPFYPAEYAAKLPKNQPQVRQCQTPAGTNKTGPNSDTSSNAPSVIQDAQTQQLPKTSAESDCAADVNSNPTPLAAAIRSAFSAGKKETLSSSASSSSSCSFSANAKAPPSWDIDQALRAIPELKREPDLESERQQAPKQPADDTQKRPQHRKLTSHPRFKRRHKSSEDSPRMVPSNSKASLPFQPPPPALDSLGPLAQLAQLPQMPMDPEELWVHEGCIVWTSGVYLVNGRLYGLQEALDGARETSCSYCEMVGSTLGCYSKGCTLRYHYLCAIESDCSLNEDNFSLRCPKHKFTQSVRPAKPVYVEQSERG
ncbi:transcription factor 20 isoform X2 [Kryptolebias marmoratus]|uniref:transcription factor 20 isoform X2 n=1 Tax=Kryptolebias marmoratus TaxID=37003 RepID=UPI0007F89A29|nr:transcription factor 20 isoform X2 [Kryptolebias marmoratus]